MVQPYIGAPVRRKEDIRLITGSAIFVDDVTVEGLLHAAILRSPHAHARIVAKDTAEARSLPGVAAVYTFEDIADIAKPIPIRMYLLPGLEQYLQYPLARDKVRYVGEPVAVAVAESRYVAEDALEAIDVTYDPLPAVVDMQESLRDEVLLHEEAGTNLGAHFTISIGDIEEAFRTAEYTLKESFRTHRHTGNPMETRGLVATYDSGSGDLTVWGPTKVPRFNREVLASLLDFPEEKVHFIEPDVGGGFGIRGEFYPEDYLIPWAAIKLERPVKWIEDRREHLMAANHSREQLLELEVAAKRDGTLLGIRARIYGNMGGYIRTHGGILPSGAARLLPGPYRVPNYHCEVHCVLTNKTGAGTFRAPGHYESSFARERLLDMVAADLKLDPVELRRKNLVQPSEMPYELGVTFPGGDPIVFDSGDYASALNRALEQSGYDKLTGLQGSLREGRYHGIGIACFVKDTGRGPYEGARVVVNGARDVAVYLGITSLGQGHATSMAQICADGLSMSMEGINVLHGSTDLTTFGFGTYSSRATVMAGNAVYKASQELKGKILAIASAHLGVAEADLEYQDGVIHRKGDTEKSPLLHISDVIELAERTGQTEGESGLETTAYFESELATFVYGTHVAHVAVDPETGQVEVVDYVVVEDVGRAINPMFVHGQAVGAAVQGIGATLLEELVYDENGQLLTTTFMDYLLPISTDVPPIESVVLEEAPSPRNPLGVKGAGEGGIVATGAALANAVSNALAPMGVQVTQLPLSPNHVREWIRERTQSTKDTL